uniref:RNA polymerase II-associated factor 1 homolog n=1 Tax=Henneguya salminicola TaxID=69463 RepID=A0A6G3MFH9_HENSL
MSINKQMHKPSHIIERTISASQNINLQINKYRSREDQILAIEKTFSDSKIPITAHHSNKELRPKFVYPVLPDESVFFLFFSSKLWKYTFSHITFDSCPSIQGKADLLEANQLNDALLKGMSDSQGEFVGYFIKNDELKYKTTTDTLAYEIVREYNWSIQNTALGATEDIYSWRIDKDSGKVLYNELSARVRLTKRRLEGGRHKNSLFSTMLIARNRDITQIEEQEQTRKMDILKKKNINLFNEDNLPLISVSSNVTEIINENADTSDNPFDDDFSNNS